MHDAYDLFVQIVNAADINPGVQARNRCHAWFLLPLSSIPRISVCGVHNLLSLRHLYSVSWALRPLSLRLSEGRYSSSSLYQSGVSKLQMWSCHGDVAPGLKVICPSPPAPPLPKLQLLRTSLSFRMIPDVLKTSPSHIFFPLCLKHCPLCHSQPPWRGLHRDALLPALCDDSRARLNAAVYVFPDYLPLFLP